MTHKEHPLQILSLAYKRIIGYGILGTLIGFSVSFAFPLQYSSSVRLLITQPNSVGVDAFTVLKSNERIAQNISQLIYSSKFFENIVSQAENLDTSMIPEKEYDRRKFWSETISTAVEPGTGLMTLTVYSTRVSQARSLVMASSNEVAKQIPNLFGTGVRVAEIDSPLDSRWITKPNIPKNAVFGGLIGLLLSTAWVLLKRGS